MLLLWHAVQAVCWHHEDSASPSVLFAAVQYCGSAHVSVLRSAHVEQEIMQHLYALK